MHSRFGKTFKAAAVLAAAFLLSSCVSADDRTTPPHIRFNSEKDVLLAKWDVTPWTMNSAMDFMPGAIAIQQPRQISDVECDGRQLEISADTSWTAPQGCKNLKWVVELAQEFDTSAAEQLSFIDKADGRFHIVMNDVTSLLRPAGGPTPDSVVYDLAAVSDDSCERQNDGWYCSWNPNGPPDFIVLQDEPFGEGYNSGGILHIFTRIREGQKDYLEAANIGLNYIREAVQSNERPFTNYWKRSCLDGEVNAATGEKLVLISGPCTEGPGADVRVLATLLHEAFHLYTQDIGAPPLWAGESLAMYYGLKAAKKSLNDGVIAPDLHSAYQILETNFLEFGSQSPGYGQLAAQAKVLSGEDPSAYGQFYFRGSVFWFKVDALIAQYDDGKSLDDLLPLLLSNEWGEGGQLPPAFVEKMQSYSKEKWAELVKEFL